MKKHITHYLLISIVMNILLGVFYFTFFHHKQSFKGDVLIERSLMATSEEMTDLSHLLTAMQNGLRWFFKKRKMHNAYTLQITEESQSFYQKLPLSNDLVSAYALYDSTHTKLIASYIEMLYAIQKEAKWRTSEIEESIEELKIATQKFDYEAFKVAKLSHQTSIQLLENDIVCTTYHIINKMGDLTGHRCCGCGSSTNFPYPIYSQEAIKLGDTFTAQIAYHIAMRSHGDERFFINGNEIPFEGYRDTISIPSLKTGKQRLELVAENKVYYPYKKTFRDTSYYEYWVVE